MSLVWLSQYISLDLIMVMSVQLFGKKYIKKGLQPLPDYIQPVVDLP